MALGVDQRALALRVGSPQQEHQAFALAIQCIDRSVSEALPAPVRMGAGTSLLHRQHAVEQQHAAVGPGGEATVAGTGHAEVALDLPEDVVQRWGYPHAAAHRKAQPMRLAGAVVGVLAQDHNPHRVERGVLEGGENLPAGWVDVLARLLLGAQKARQRPHLGPLQVVADARLPRRLQLDRALAHASFPAGSPWACPRSRRCRATRNWNSSLVTSSLSSTGFSTRSLAPARISAAWLAGFSSPVITSTGRRPLPYPNSLRMCSSRSPPVNSPVRLTSLSTTSAPTQPRARSVSSRGSEEHTSEL